MTTYAAYLCAFSDEGGATDLCAQFDAIQAEAADRGVVISKIFSDTTAHSDTADNRVGLQQAIASAKAGDFQALFISAHDRLSRNPDNRHALVKAHIIPHKVTLIVAAAKGNA